jgi:hypothetical protein
MELTRSIGPRMIKIENGRYPYGPRIGTRTRSEKKTSARYSRPMLRRIRKRLGLNSLLSRSQEESASTYVQTTPTAESGIIASVIGPSDIETR